MLMPRAAFDAVGGFDERFPLYAEELDLATRMRDAGFHVVFTPAAEVIHAVGVSTGGDRRSHRLGVMHSTSLYRYYATHRSGGWRRVTLPVVWLALRARAELAWLIGKVGKR
jgi:N-acetylglucosaminyl-diphospho-decaprenol L-rhamnosyltransferase